MKQLLHGQRPAEDDVAGRYAEPTLNLHARPNWENFFKYVYVEGEVNFDGRLCDKVIFNFPAFGTVGYIVENGENIENIATKFHLNRYMILEKNPDIRKYSDVKTGQHIVIPNNYFSKLILYIDKETKIPLVEIFYDDLGLYKQYEFINLKANVAFSNLDFSKDNPAFHF